MTNEGARHPFRVRHLPPATVLPRRRYRGGINLADVRDFLLSFSTFFLASIVFLA